MLEYLYVFQIWIIIGVVMIVLEMMDTSTIFFLPLGLAGLIMALWLYLVEIQVMPITSLPTKWFWLLLIWAVIGFVNTLILAYLRKIGVLSGRQSSGDINHY
jgi:membrane protein implicated in regulation of membrane protease activity